jgi:hypothetical protein
MEKFCLVWRNIIALLDTRLLPYFLDLETQRTMSFLLTIRLNYYIFLSQLYWLSRNTRKITELIKEKEVWVINTLELLKQEKNFWMKKSWDNKQILNDTETQKMFKHIIPLTNRNIEELQSSQKWKVIDLESTETTFITGDNPFLINNKTFRMDNVLKINFQAVSKVLFYLISHLIFWLNSSCKY